jgi:hypothetical protein
MTCSLACIAGCQLLLTKRLNGTKTCSSKTCWCNRSSPKITLKWLQRLEWFSCLHISSIFSGSCDHSESRKREWILILRTQQPVLPNTKPSFGYMCRMNTVPNSDVYLSIHLKVYRAAISSRLQWLLDPISHSLMDMICPAMMKNS